MKLPRSIRRIVGSESFADAVLGDLEELRRTETERLGRVRGSARHYRRLASVLFHSLRGQGPGLLTGLRLDLSSCVRRWSRTPLVAAAMIFSLALGIGATASVFSVIEGVLLRPLPYPDADSLVLVRSEFPQQGRGDSRTSPPEFLDLHESAAFADVGMAWYRPGAMTDAGVEPEDVDMAFVSAGFLATLGVEPLLGRLPTLEEGLPDGPNVVVLAHATWQRRYGGDPEVVGRTIAFDDVPHEVVGILPPDMRMLFPADVGMPRELAAWVPWGGDYAEFDRNWRVLTVLGRLAPGTSIEQTQAALDTLAAQLVDEYSDAYGASGLRWRLESLAAAIVAPVRPILLILFAAVWLVLIVACANVGNLMLARAARDRHESVVRTALGASSWRLLRQTLADSTLIAGLGTAAGTLLAAVAVAALPALAPADLPRVDSVSLNWSTLGYMAGAMAATTLLLSAMVAHQTLRGGRGSVLRTQRTSTGSDVRTRQVLTVAQVTLAMVLVVGASMLLQSFARLAAVEPGYDPAGVLTMKLSLVDSHYSYVEPERIADFYRQLEERVAEIPGVDGAGATSQLPLDGTFAVKSYAYEETDGALTEGNTAQYRVVTPGWFQAMGSDLIEGRTFSADDTAEAPAVIVIDDVLANRVWPGESALGQRVLLGATFNQGPTWAEVVGVVRHMRQHPRLVGAEQIYQPHQQFALRTMALTLRTDLAPAPLLATVRGVVQNLNAVQPLQRVRSLDSYLGQAVATTRFALDLLLVTAIIALVLAMVGTYSIVAFMVSQRRREFGVRMAMGATPADTVRTALRAGAALVALGIVVGVPAALAFASSLRGLLFGVSVADPLILTGTAVGIATLGLLASAVPARRAGKLSPVVALRAE